MAISDISLTSGMKSNLLSLQNTVTLLNRTQQRLSSGKKVNSALDDPTSYFAAQALSARAGIIDGLKSAMGQATQTVTAANQGVSGISSLISQAKAVAQSATSAASGSAGGTSTGTAADAITYSTVGLTLANMSAASYSTESLTLAGVAAGTYSTESLTLNNPAAAVDATVTLTLSNAQAITYGTETVTLAGMTSLSTYATETVTLSGMTSAAATYDTESLTLAGMTSQAAVDATQVFTFSGVTVTAATYDTETFTLLNVVTGDALTIGGQLFTADTEFAVGVSDSDTADNLVTAIMNNGTLTNAGYLASNNGGIVTVSYAPSSVPANIPAGDLGSANITQAPVAGIPATADTITIGGESFIAGTDFLLGSSDTDAANNLANAIMLNGTLTNAGYTATANLGVLTLSFAGVNMPAVTSDTEFGAAAAVAGSAATGDTVTIGGVTLTAGTDFIVSGTDAQDAQALANAINASGAITNAGYTAAADGITNVVTLSYTGNIDPNDVTVASSITTGINSGTPATGDTITIGGTTLTAGTNFIVGNGNTLDAQALANAIMANGTLTNAGYSASANLGVVTITFASGNIPGGDAVSAHATLTPIPATATGDTITIGGVTLTAGTDFTVGVSNTTDAQALANAIMANGTLTNAGYSASANLGVVTVSFAGASVPGGDSVSAHAVVAPVSGSPANSVTIGSVTLTAGTDFTVGVSNTIDAQALANAIMANGTLTNAGYSASANLGVVTLTLTGGVNPANVTGDSTIIEADIPGSAADSVTIGGVTLTAGTDFTVGISNTTDAQALANAIMANGTLTNAGYTASANLGVVTVSYTGANVPAGDAGDAAIVVAPVAGNPFSVVTIAGVTLTAGTNFAIGGSDTTTATNLANAIMANGTLTNAGYSASANLGVVTLTFAGANVPGGDAASGGITRATIAGSGGDAITFGGVTLTAGTNFSVAGTNAQDATALANAINANGTLTGLGYVASANGVSSVVTLSRTGNDVTTGGVTVPGSITSAAATAHSETMSYTYNSNPYTGTGATATLAAADLQTNLLAVPNVTAATVSAGGSVSITATATPSAQLTSLQTQYNDILAQITSLSADSGYQGKNLLAGDVLTVQFEGAHSLTITGFSATATGLGLTTATWTGSGVIAADIALLDTATSTLSSNSSSLASSLSIITVRQNFSTNMVNTLTTGADNLTLADTNEEGANMLMLQTRQSLGVTALSLSSQAAQSVLKLFA